jgi:peptidoglycan hydrolase-like protein with peptidoglycan-binding domain
MLLGLLVLLSALTISTVAIYYSVAGLVAIFAAAAWPIIVMGTALEVAKLVTTVWLHQFWHTAAWWLKYYLTAAVVVLMMITSIGIFGYLSKAHIEQTSASGQASAQLTQIDQSIARLAATVSRAEQRIRELESGSGVRSTLQDQISKEQQQINAEYQQLQLVVAEQTQIISARKAVYQTQIDKIDNDMRTLQQYIAAGAIRQAQSLVGVNADGNYGPETAAAFAAFQKDRQDFRKQLVSSLLDIENDPVVIEARVQIQRARSASEQRVQQLNNSVDTLRKQLVNETTSNSMVQISEQTAIANRANAQISQLTQEKFALESDYRKLEAEVGPIKYIAELFYDNADSKTLESAVRWLIIIIIFVFDPLAVLLLIASQYTFNYYRSRTVIVAATNTVASEEQTVEKTVEPVAAEPAPEQYSLALEIADQEPVAVLQPAEPEPVYMTATRIQNPKKESEMPSIKVPQGYIQNEEQSNDSIWKKLQAQKAQNTSL